MMESVILIDKPKGISSFDAVRSLRNKLGVRKIGHAGTLDPLASGLMIIGVGDGTKKLNEYIKLPKTYKVDIMLGESRTTGDMEGDIIEEKPLDDIPHEAVRDVFVALAGELKLPVPRYSAVKQDGVPLYKKARAGAEFEPPVKTMRIFTIYLSNIVCGAGRCTLSASMEVGSGTYVRSIAQEIGSRLGAPACVKELRRTRIGDFKIEDAQQLDDAVSGS